MASVASSYLGEVIDESDCHYSEASSSVQGVLTPLPVAHQISENCRDDGTVTPVQTPIETPVSMEGYSLEVTPNSTDLPPTLSPSTAGVPQPSSNDSVASFLSESTFNSNYTASTNQISYAENKPAAKASDLDGSSVKSTKLNLSFLPVRDSGSVSTCGSVYSRSSKRSVRRRDVIKPVALTAVKDDSPTSPQGNQWAMPNPQAGCADLVPVNNENNLALVLHAKEQRGIDPTETTRGSARDPPGEPSTSSHGKKYRTVQWVDPKTITDESAIDYDMLNKYRALSNYDEEPEAPRRIRIATISSGYKTANFFVREDLDQRIYFHELEDAVSYMARRGYARMERGEEKEWMRLLGRAHQVVKVRVCCACFGAHHVLDQSAQV